MLDIINWMLKAWPITVFTFVAIIFLWDISHKLYVASKAEKQEDQY